MLLDHDLRANALPFVAREDRYTLVRIMALIAHAEDLQERRCLRILRSLALCPGILYRRTLYRRTLRRRTFDPRALHPPDLFSEVFCPCSMDGQDVSVLLHELMR